MSGIEVDESIATLYNEMKMRKTHKWATFRINDEKTSIVIDELGEPKDTGSVADDKEAFGELAGKLVASQPRYILYDFNFVGKEGRKVEKLAFIFW